MKTRVAISIVLGLCTFVALSIADEYFTSPGHRETPAASWLLTALYLALAQFLLAPKGKGFVATRPTLAAMLTPVAFLFLLALVAEKHANIAAQPAGGSFSVAVG
jgi:hypothetical protein